MRNGEGGKKGRRKEVDEEKGREKMKEGEASSDAFNQTRLKCEPIFQKTPNLPERFLLCESEQQVELFLLSLQLNHHRRRRRRKETSSGQRSDDGKHGGNQTFHVFA